MGTLNPNLINNNERIPEISSILAIGILRRRKRLGITNSLDFRTLQSVHGDDNHIGDFYNEKQRFSGACKSENHDK